MKFLLDTNICIFLGRRTHPLLEYEVSSRDRRDFAISAITIGELAYGRATGASNRSIDFVVSNLRVIPFDEGAAHAFGDVRADLEHRGIVIGPYDLQIAAHALSVGYTLVTNNTRELARVRGLKVVDWTRGD